MAQQQKGMGCGNGSTNLSDTRVFVGRTERGFGGLCQKCGETLANLLITS